MSSKRKRSEMWCFFTRVDESLKLAKCDICSYKLSYSTTSNLKRHLINKHPTEINCDLQTDAVTDTNTCVDENSNSSMEFTTPTTLFVKNKKQQKGIKTELSKSTKKFIKKKTSPMWSFFTIMNDTSKLAKCELCGCNLSYTAISNLKRHLIKKHPTEISFEVQTEECENMNVNDDEIIIDSDSTTWSVRNKQQEKSQQNVQCSSNPKKDRKTSAIWNLFTLTDDATVAECNICERRISYQSSTSNLKRHYIKKHSPDGNLDVKNASNEETNTFIIDHNPFKNEHKPLTFTTPATSATVTASKQMKPILYNPKKIDKSLLNLFIKDFHPFSIVEDKGFVEFVKTLNPAYKLPEKKAISTNMIPSVYEKCYDLVQEKLKLVNLFCLTTDCWTSRNGDKYLTVTAHYVDDNFEHKSIFLGCVKIESCDSGSNLADAIRNLTDKFDISNKILIVVTGNEIIVKNAIVDHLQWEHFGCYVHTLNVIVQNSLESVIPIIDKVHTIVEHLRSNPVAMQNLVSYQVNAGLSPIKKLIHDVKSMWNSTFYMLQRFLELEDAVKITLDLLEHDYPNIQQEEWKILHDLCKILKPFEEITMRISSETELNVGQIIIFTNGLVSVCKSLKQDKLHETVKKVLNDLSAGVSESFADIENNKIIATCTFLDPRFKLVGFFNPSAADSIKNHVVQLVANKISEKTKVSQAVDDETKINSGAETELTVFSNFDSRTDVLNSKVLVTYSDPSDDDTIKNYVIEVVTTETEEDEKALQCKDSENEISTVIETDGISIFQYFDSRTAVLNPKRSNEDTAITEVRRYIDEPLLPRNESPLLWWKENRHFYPNLEKVAKEKFCMLATSAPSKQLFSKAGLVIRDRISRLNPKHVEKLLFLNCNSYLFEK